MPNCLICPPFLCPLLPHTYNSYFHFGFKQIAVFSFFKQLTQIHLYLKYLLYINSFVLWFNHLFIIQQIFPCVRLWVHCKKLSSSPLPPRQKQFSSHCPSWTFRASSNFSSWYLLLLCMRFYSRKRVREKSKKTH